MLIEKLLLQLKTSHSLKFSFLKQELNIDERTLQQLIEQLSELGIEHKIDDKTIVFPQLYQLLNKSKIISQIDRKFRSRIEPIIYKIVTTSTNEEVKKQKNATDKGAICFAEMQTTGRGRRGAEWISPFTSNLYLSIRLPVIRVDKIGLLPLGVGVAVKQALKQCGVTNVGLKWPNDIYLGDKKLGGIIIELTRNEVSRVTIGIGINVNLRPQDAAKIDQPWCSLISNGYNIERNRLLPLIINQTMNIVEQFEMNNEQHFINEWKESDYLYGKMIFVETERGRESGLAKGIGNEGALIINNNGFDKEITSGHIVEAK